MYSGGAHSVYEQLRSNGLSEFALIMPSDGGLFNGSAYLPTAQYGNYEKWLVEDVLSAARMCIEGVDENSSLYIVGLSMGGYGALRLGAKYPGLFRSFSGLSSITDIEQMELFVEEGLDTYACEDDRDPSITYWMEVNRDQLPPFRLECGRSDLLLDANIALHEKLNAMSIPHDFELYEGSHDWDYWHRSIARTLVYFDELDC